MKRLSTQHSALRTQAGIAQGWLYLIGLIVLLGLISSILYGVTSYLKHVDAQGYKRGVDETTAAYAKRDNEALRKANEEIQLLQNQARAAELAHAQKLAAIAAQRAKEKADAEKQKERDRADVRSGAIKLRDPGAAACPAPGGERAGPAPGAAPGGGDAGAGGQLSGEASTFLLDLANEADDVARQLARAQQVIVEQIRTCNAP